MLSIILNAFAVTIIALFAGLIYKGIDRKLAARMQGRTGPPLQQAFRDVRKLMFKENLIPKNAVPWLFNSMPILCAASAAAVLLFIPLLGVNLLGAYGDMILVVYLFMLPALAMVIGGLSSGSPFAVIGSQREMVMLMSYELPLATAVLAFAFKFGSFLFPTAVIWATVGPLGVVGFLILFFTLLVVMPAELSKIPFDAPEAETEIAGGLFVEYSGRNLGMFYLADAVRSVAFAAFVVALFLPFSLGILWQDVLFFFAKLFAVLLVAVTFVRVAVPRLQIDKSSRLFLVYITIFSIIGLVLVMLDSGVVI